MIETPAQASDLVFYLQLFRAGSASVSIVPSGSANGLTAVF